MDLYKAWEPTILAGSQVIWGARGSAPLVLGLWAVTLESKPSMALKIFVDLGGTSGMWYRMLAGFLIRAIAI